MCNRAAQQPRRIHNSLLLQCSTFHNNFALSSSWLLLCATFNQPCKIFYSCGMPPESFLQSMYLLFVDISKNFMGLVSQPHPTVDVLKTQLPKWHPTVHFSQIQTLHKHLSRILWSSHHSKSLLAVAYLCYWLLAVKVLWTPSSVQDSLLVHQ